MFVVIKKKCDRVEREKGDENSFFDCILRHNTTRLFFTQRVFCFVTFPVLFNLYLEKGQTAFQRKFERWVYSIV